MSAKEKDLEIEDELARGTGIGPVCIMRRACSQLDSSEDTSRTQGEDLIAIKEELRSGEGCAIPRFANCLADPESHGSRRGEICLESHRVYFAHIQQREEMASHMEDTTDIQEGHFPNDERTQRYGNLLFLLQSEPRHIAHLCRLVSMAEIDALLQTVMFTIYGNQYESREEHLLLTMFQVRLRHHEYVEHANHLS
jgi:Ras GTPase-activating-like protein IQGAP2/3